MKVANAETAGAIGVIVYNHTPGAPLLTMGGTASPTIPAVFIANEAGEELETELGRNPGLEATLSPVSP